MFKIIRPVDVSNNERIKMTQHVGCEKIINSKIVLCVLFNQQVENKFSLLEVKFQ